MAWRAAVATAITGAVGYGPILVIEKVFLKHTNTGDIEELSSNLFLIGAAMVVAGIWIIVAGVQRADRSAGGGQPISMRVAAWMGVSQGLCLPFRGLSRSGATISTALLAPRQPAPGRRVQLCAGGHHHSSRDRARIAPPPQSLPRGDS